MAPNYLFVIAAAILLASGFVAHPSPREETPAAASQKDLLHVLQRPGCAARGRQVFFDRARAKCSGCHSIESDEGPVGPNLWTVGAKYDKQGLLDAILQPSAEIAPQYHVYILDTETRGLVVGLISEDTADDVVVRDETGDEIRLKSSEVLDRRKSELSMMPGDIADTISERELADLLEFLSTLRPDSSVAQN